MLEGGEIEIQGILAQMKWMLNPLHWMTRMYGTCAVVPNVRGNACGCIEHNGGRRRFES